MSTAAMLLVVVLAGLATGLGAGLAAFAWWMERQR
jgi:hypothetical protein